LCRPRLWLSAPLPEAPEVHNTSTLTNLVWLTWTLATNAPARNLVLYQRVGRQWRGEILSPRVTQRIFDRRRGQKIPEEVRLIPISRIGAEGPAAVWMEK
jgi:hypothetical protein